MAGFCVIVVSAYQAKIFTTRNVVHSEVEPGPNLVESAEMQIVDEAESGFGATVGRALTRKLVADSLHILRRNNGHTLVLVASAAMLQSLREACGQLDCGNIEVLEYEGDLMSLSAEGVQETLSQAGILPQRTTAEGLSTS